MAFPDLNQTNFNNEQLFNLLDSLPSIALIVDEELKIEFANQSFKRFIEKSFSDISNRTLIELLPEKTGRRVEQIIDEISADKTSRSRTIEVCMDEIEHRPQKWTIKSDTDKSGDSQRYYVFGPDSINPPQNGQTQSDTQLNKKVFRKMANSIQEAFWLMDSNWSEVLYANETCENIYGIPLNELTRDVENWTKHIVQPDLDRLYSNLAPTKIEDLNETINVQFRLDHPEKGLRHINLEISPIPEEGKTEQLVGLASDITAKENKLQESQQKFEAIFNSTVSLLGLLNADGLLLEANQSALDLIDATMEDLHGQLFWETPWWTHSEDLQKRVQKAVNKAASGEAVQFEVTHSLSEDEEKTIEFAITPIRNERGEVEYLLPEGRDITDQKQLQNDLENQRNFLESIIDTAQQGIFVKNWDGEYILANETVSEIFGVPRERIEGNTDYDLINDELAEKFERKDLNVLKTGESLQYEDQIYDAARGEKRTFLTVKTPLFIDKPREKRLLIGITTDITKRKSLQQELEKQKNFLQKIIDSAPNFIFVKDWDGVFQIANESLATFYDTTTDDLIGQTDADYNQNIEEVKSFREADREVMRSGEIKEISEEPVTNLHTGETHWFQTIKVPLFTDNPVEDRQVLGVSTEITEKKNIRESLEQSLHEKEALLGEIHHRVKNNLQIVQSLLKMEMRDAEGKIPALQDCKNRIDSMALLHEKLYQSDQLDEIDMASYLKDLCQHLKGAVGTATDDIEISLSVDLGSFPIKEAVSCGLVVNELITNALQHAFKDGEEGQIDVTFQRIESGNRITVADNGHGLPEGLKISELQSTGIKIIRSIVEHEFDGEINFTEADGLKVSVFLRS